MGRCYVGFSHPLSREDPAPDSGRRAVEQAGFPLCAEDLGATQGSEGVWLPHAWPLARPPLRGLLDPHCQGHERATAAPISGPLAADKPCSPSLARRRG
ncbi:MAG: hypothetical protein ACYTDV_12845 [Planctomycetota bacterium]